MAENSELVKEIRQARKSHDVAFLDDSDRSPQQLDFWLERAGQSLAGTLPRPKDVRTAEEYALYQAISTANPALTADVLEVARIHPETAGAINPTAAYAILAQAYERSIAKLDQSLQMIRALGQSLTSEQIDQALDKRKLLEEVNRRLQQSAGENEVARIQELSNSPKFSQFNPPELQYKLNPEFLNKAVDE